MIRTFKKNRPKISPDAFVHDSAEVIGKVILKSKVSVWPLCVLRGDIDKIVIGEKSNIQDHTVIHTRAGSPTIIGREVTVGHSVILHGCRIGDGVLVGMGAIVMETSIGAGSLIGAGAVVTAGLKVPPNSLVLGSPARVLRKVSPRERAHMKRGMKAYQGYLKAHQQASQVVFS